ncbi:conserved Plasmodium protein, unknown function [Plasmodium ovale wallikeri]|uniref:Uncharacterized protein n=1 Tax=Plasmodium ovale wallikeri TaxID=864142 RepID=A0A1A8ZCG3_PLAOA|nr:conserved Plasmodium protein, unknown function [Plasmodium ovale wallikeri]
MEGKRDNVNIKPEIKKILKSIRESENTKDKFVNILKLTKNTKSIEENDKYTILKAIDCEFLCLLLRSKNEFRLFTLRLINSLISKSTSSILKKCVPFVNSIIFYYLHDVKRVHRRVKKGYDSAGGNYSAESGSSCEDENKEQPSGTDSMKDINLIYNECLIFFLKMEPLLKVEEMVRSTYMNYENNDLDVDVEMYFFNKRLKKKYREENITSSKYINGNSKNCHGKTEKENNDKRDMSDDMTGERNSSDSEDIDSDSTLSENEDENFISKGDDIYFSDEENVCIIELILSLLKENISVREILKGELLTSHDGTPHNGSLHQVEKNDISEKCSDKENKKKSEHFTEISITTATEVKGKTDGEYTKEDTLLCKENVNLSLLFLNNIILKLPHNKFVREYFFFLNKVIENYEQENRITAINCLTNMNVYIKKYNLQNILDKNCIFKFYANIIYLFSEMKNEKEKKNVYILYSTVYTCLNFMYVNKISSDIFKTPLSYMNVELYLFFEDVIKFVHKKDTNNFLFDRTHFDHMIRLICNNIGYIISFLSQNCSLSSEFAVGDDSHEDVHQREANPSVNGIKDRESNNKNVIEGDLSDSLEGQLCSGNSYPSPQKDISKEHITNEKREKGTNNRNSYICTIRETKEEKKKTNKQKTVEVSDVYLILTKVKKSIELLVEFFKDIKNEFKREKKNDNHFRMFKEKFKDELDSLICLFCNYLLHENVHYVDDFLSLLELFSECVGEKNFYFFLLVIKNIDADRYFSNKTFMTKLFLYVLDVSMKNVVHIKILFSVFSKCPFDVMQFVQVNSWEHVLENFRWSDGVSEKGEISGNGNTSGRIETVANLGTIEYQANEYNLIEPLHAPVDKLSNVRFVYIICEDEYRKKSGDNNFKENIQNIVLFSAHFFLRYYFNILHQKGETVAHKRFDVFRDNYYNICNSQIDKDERKFFLSVKVLLCISSLLFMRFDSTVIAAILQKRDVLFIQKIMYNDGRDNKRATLEQAMLPQLLNGEIFMLLYEEEEEQLQQKLQQLRGLKKIKTSDLISNYLMFFVLFVHKIIKKNEEGKILTELEKEDEKKKFIKENIDKIKEKLKERKNGTNVKEDVRNFTSDKQGQSVSYVRMEDKESHSPQKGPKMGRHIGDGVSSGGGSEGEACNFAKICEGLTCAFRICILLLVCNLRSKGDPEERVFLEKRQNDALPFLSRIGEAQNEDQTYEQNRTSQSQEGRGEFFNRSSTDGSTLSFRLHLLYISLCYYHMYLLNGDDVYYLHVSLLLFLNIFPHFRNKEIRHYLSTSKEVFVTLLFYAYAERGEKRCTDVEVINIFQSINEVFLECDFFTVSTLFVLKGIDMHLALLERNIKDIKMGRKVEEHTEKQGSEESSSKITCEQKSGKNVHYYTFDEESNDNTILEKKDDISLDEKLKKIMDVSISLYNNITECSYLFLDMHLLSVYEHLIHVSLYMIKDVYNLFDTLKREKEKKTLLEYIHMAYRNLLEVYIIYLKYNYLNYSQTECASEKVYRNVEHICKSGEKVKKEFFSLLGHECDNGREEIKKGDISENKPTREYTKSHFYDNKIFLYDKINSIDKEVTHLDGFIFVVNDDLNREAWTSKCDHDFFHKRKEYNFDIVSSIISDNNILYRFIYEHILKENNLNFEIEEREQNIFQVSHLHDEMSFSKFFKENLKEIDQKVEEIFTLIKMGKCSTAVIGPGPMNSSLTGVGDNVHIDVSHYNEFFQIFQFKKVKLAHIKFDVCNFYHTKYSNMAINKMKKMYRSFSKCRGHREYEKFVVSSSSSTSCSQKGGENEKKKWIHYDDNIHYFCYNFGEIQFLFKNIKKYKKKSLEYFSLFNQTTLHLDILINSSEAYFYFNFFTKSFDEYIKNYREMLNSFSYPLQFIEHKQYLSYKRELTLKCALLLKDIYICKKWNTLNENIYFNSYNKKKNLNFDDNLCGILSTEEKKIILQVVKYYFAFLNTYPIEKEATTVIIFENEEEKKSYFDIYFYVCKTLSTVEDKNFMTQAINHYKYLLSYSLKNKMYQDDKYNEHMQNFCKKSIYMLSLKLNELH